MSASPQIDEFSDATLREALLELPKLQLAEALASLPRAAMAAALREAGAEIGGASAADAARAEAEREASRSARRQTLDPATAIFENWTSTADCFIRNRSDTGFLVESGGAALPDRFHLLVQAEDATYPVRVAWRHGSQLGLAIDEG